MAIAGPLAGKAPIVKRPPGGVLPDTEYACFCGKGAHGDRGEQLCTDTQGTWGFRDDIPVGHRSSDSLYVRIRLFFALP